jgi:hypothetical protein
MSIQSIFSNPVSGPAAESRKGRVVAGFTQVFASILSKQLRSSGMGEEGGLLGTAGGTAGDVYGAFFDGAMGHALATSSAMKPLNQAIEHELERPVHPSEARHATLHQSESKSDQNVAVGSNSDMLYTSISARNGTDLELPSDSHGPLLLPPESAGVASVLPPPPRSES